MTTEEQNQQLELAQLRKDNDRLNRELPKMRKENQRLTGFLQDAAAYIRTAVREKGDTAIINTLYHDLNGLAKDEPCFLPRVHGYAAAEARKGRRFKATFEGGQITSATEALRDIADFGRSYGITDADAISGIRNKARHALAQDHTFNKAD